MAEEIKDEKPTKNTGKNIWRYTTIALLVIVVLLVAVFMLPSNSSKSSTSTTGMTIAAQNDVANKALVYINKNLLSSNNSASLDSVTENSGILNITISIQGQKIPVYTTEDGKLLILPNGGILDMTQPLPSPTQTQQQQQPGPANCSEVGKTTTPELDAFVVSNCPYGLQMQRVLVPVEQFFGTKANIKIRYIGSFGNDSTSCSYGICSMHGSKGS